MVERDTDGRTLLVRLRAALPTLRPSERRVADLLVAEPMLAANLSVAELAQRAGTSTTSVHRCTQQLGYARFRDLRVDLAREATREHLATAERFAVSGDIDRADSLADIVAKVAMTETLSISDTSAALDVAMLGRAVAAVGGARRVDAFGVGASAFVATDLQQKLIRIGRTALSWPDPHGAWTSAATLDSECVAVGVSHSGATADTAQFLRFARRAGAVTIGITNFPISAVGEESDIVLTTAARETTFRSGALGSRIAQLMVVDCLFIGVATATYEESMYALRATYAAVHPSRP
jgi:DNA-binding MurR/RpiR family transcriptional regulator